MRCFVIGLLILMIVVNINMEDLNILDDILVYPIPVTTKIEKRDTSKQLSESMNAFIEEKLTEHSQALEYLVKIINNHEEITKQLLEHLSKNIEKPELPIKIAPPIAKQKYSRRSYEPVENPVLRLGNSIHKFGKLATNLLLKELQSDTDPTPLIEIKPDLPLTSNRRSFDDYQTVDPNKQNKNELNPWCEIALLCKIMGDSVCGFDDNYGYGKFHDICHMLNVNCYYKYNFVLLHTCHPTL